MVGRAFGAIRGAGLRSALVLACMLGLTLAVAACGSQDKSRSSGSTGGSSAVGDTIAFGTDPTYPPLEFRAGSSIEGAEVELMEAVADELGAKATWVAGDFATLVPSLKADRFQAIAAGMLDQPQKRGNVLFVDYLGNPGVGGLFRAGEVPPSDDPRYLCDVTIAVGKGTGIADGAEPALPIMTRDVCPQPVKTLILPNEPAAQLAVQSGRADAFMTSYMSVGYIAKTAGGGTKFKAINYPLPAGANSNQLQNPIAIGVRAGDTALANELKAAIQSVMDNGTYEQVLARYGIESMAIDAPLINGQ